MKRFISALILSVVAVSAFAIEIDKEIVSVELIHKEVITQIILDQRVRQAEAQVAQYAQMGYPVEPVTRESVLDSMISEILLNQGAEDSGITVAESEVQAQVEQQRQQASQSLQQEISLAQFVSLVESNYKIAWEKFVDEIRNQILVQKFVASRLPEYSPEIAEVSREQVEAEYDRKKTSFVTADHRRYSHIFFSTFNLAPVEKAKAYENAQAVLGKAENGVATFEELASEYSEDPKSKYKDGEVGWIVRDNQQFINELGGEYVEAIFTAPVNRIVGVVESKRGYHIIKVLEEDPAKLRELDDPVNPWSEATVREYITEAFQQQNALAAQQAGLEALVEALKEEADIVYRDGR